MSYTNRQFVIDFYALWNSPQSELKGLSPEEKDAARAMYFRENYGAIWQAVQDVHLRVALQVMEYIARRRPALAAKTELIPQCLLVAVFSLVAIDHNPSPSDVEIETAEAVLAPKS